MQPYHAIDDGRWAVSELGPERIQSSYAWKSLLDAGATLAFGSNWPVACDGHLCRHDPPHPRRQEPERMDS
jgi:predicted amidohydrolase YtcJ